MAVHSILASCIKRTIDVVLSLLGTVLVLPLVPTICGLIVLDSPGSPFYVRVRIGRNGRRFGMIKFRSMFVDAANRVPDPARLKQIEAEGRVLKLDNDPRVTRIGKILRSTSLDELPQLINVLLGHMSLVGPRALVPSMLEPYPDWAKARSVVRPGLSGLWQVSARERNESLADMIDYDLDYIRNWSLLRDVVILARTPRAVLSRKGAI